MKKIFNQTKKPREDKHIRSRNRDFEWDNIEDDSDEAGFYTQELLGVLDGVDDDEEEPYEHEAEEPAYYDEDYEEDSYEDDSYEDDRNQAVAASAYYVEESISAQAAEVAAEYAEDMYEDEEYEAEDYEEDAEYYEEESEYYEEEAEYYEEEEPDYYEEEQYDDEDEDEDEYPVRVRRKLPHEEKPSFGGGLFGAKAMDRIVIATGVIVLLLALITGGVYIGAKMVDGQASEFVSVGSQLEDIDMIGEKGLLAVADAQIARLAAAEAVEDDEKLPDYNEAEYSNLTSVELDMVSIQKDLKIKFTNKKTDKLIANVPFTVTITTPANKTETWTDDDMDGIIYKKGITPGKYMVEVGELSDSKYEDYLLPVGAETVEVKKDIDYKKVDVKNEIKKEEQVDPKKEDTKKNVTEQESKLKDTVAWVESTVVAETYVEVAKNTVPDPLTLIAKSKFMRTASYTGTLSDTALTLTQGGTHTLSVSFVDSTGASVNPTTITWISTNNEVATVDANGVVTAVAVGNPVDIIYTATFVAKDVSGNQITESVTGTCKVTVVAGLQMTLDKTAATVYLKTPVTITATVTNATTDAAVTATSGDENIATVSVEGKVVTVTGVNAGSATITVAYTENGTEVKATCAVTVKVHPQDDTTTKLLDADGRQLYVLDGGKYREAVHADYYTASQFFLRGEAKYTGWQTLDGKVYFFDANGKKVTGEQVIQGAKYTFASDGSLVTGTGTMGIDVSKWNGSIDWKAVKNSGVSYVIIRCGYRGSSQGALIEDPKFESNIKGATNAGLKVGVYFFTQAVDEVEAVEEASMVLEMVKGYKISYPIFLDVEPSGGRADGISKSTRTAVCKAFCETIKDAGYTAGIYANKTWLNEKIDASALSGYKIWLAQYAATPTYSGRYDLWQYSSTGRVSGISGNVDLNISYLGY